MSVKNAHAGASLVRKELTNVDSSTGPGDVFFRGLPSGFPLWSLHVVYLVVCLLCSCGLQLVFLVIFQSSFVSPRVHAKLSIPTALAHNRAGWGQSERHSLTSHEHQWVIDTFHKDARKRCPSQAPKKCGLGANNGSVVEPR